MLPTASKEEAGRQQQEHKGNVFREEQAKRRIEASLKLDKRTNLTTMPYKIRKIHAGKTVEVEKFYDYRDNRGNETRMPRVELSPEKKKEKNERAAERKLRQLMNANFTNDSWYLTMDCIKEAELPYVTPEEMNKLLGAFQRKCRTFWKRRGAELRYVSVMAVGKQSARHFHLVLSDCPGVGYKAMRESLQAIWDSVYLTSGRTRKSYIHLENLYGDNYGDLAAYFIKQSKTTFETIGRKIGKRWNSSRNLIKPTVTTKSITDREAFRMKPVAPKGYYIDEKYTIIGSEDTEFGGYDYMRYILIKRDVHRNE